MTEDQTERLISALERIAARLETPYSPLRDGQINLLPGHPLGVWMRCEPPQVSPQYPLAPQTMWGNDQPVQRATARPAADPTATE